MELQSGDVALRANAGTVDDDGLVLDRRAGRISSTQPVVDALGAIAINDVHVLLQPSLGHHLGLVLRGEGLSHRVSDQDPDATGQPLLTAAALDGTPAAAKTARMLNQFSRIARDRLQHAPFNRDRRRQELPPANAILFRGAGTLPRDLPPFPQRWGLKTAFVAGAPMYRGLARLLGMAVVSFAPDDGVTGVAGSNLAHKIATAIRGTHLMPILLGLVGRSPLYGA